MKTKYLAAGMSALALCVALGGVYGVASAGARSSVQDDRAAADNAAKAKSALAKRDGVTAVRYAELAVALRPQVADYRATLGQAYLLAGRFGSARTALADALALSPGDGKVALNLALAQIADGDWSGARQTLDRNSGSISVGDRGLAMALAGDPAGAVDLMLPVARQPGADSKLRQNLALSLALAGRWQDAKVVAAMDLSPTDTDKRIMQWAAFARPTGKSDQIASLLGVTPANDPGQPVALALNASSPVAAAPAPVDSYMPKAPEAAVVATAAADNGAVPTGAVPVAAVAPQVPSIVFAPRAEVVQPLPVKTATGPTAKITIAQAATPAPGTNSPFVKPVKAAFVKPLVATNSTPGAAKVSVGKGNFFVQLGAYDNAGVARDGWARASRAYSGFAGKAPQGMPVTVGGKSFYRLSVGGFDRAGAVKLCQGYRQRGGVCFIREGAGDKAAAWAKR
ncbi:MAG: tetratricopeptide repeat protein [Pseudomonadota bacterium]